MKDYTRNGILANAFLKDNSFSAHEYVEEFVAEMKPSRNQRGQEKAAAKAEKARRRQDDELDD